MKLDSVKIKEYLFRTRTHQYELAAKLGVSEAFLSKVIRGRVKPSEVLVERVNEILNDQYK